MVQWNCTWLVGHVASFSAGSVVRGLAALPSEWVWSEMRRVADKLGTDPLARPFDSGLGISVLNITAFVYIDNILGGYYERRRWERSQG